jgi:hypothetical protein
VLRCGSGLITYDEAAFLGSDLQVIERPSDAERRRLDDIAERIGERWHDRRRELARLTHAQENGPPGATRRAKNRFTRRSST